MDCIDIVFSIKTLQKQVGYLLSKDKEFKIHGYTPNFSESMFKLIKKDDKQWEKEFKKRSQSGVHPNPVDEEKPDITPQLVKTLKRTKRKTEKNPRIERYLKYKALFVNNHEEDEQ